MTTVLASSQAMDIDVIDLSDSDEIEIICEFITVANEKRLKLYNEVSDRKPALAILPEVIWRNILTFLSRDNWLVSRLVSKALKPLADIEINSGVETLEIAANFPSDDYIDKVRFWSQFFVRVKNLIFKPINVEFKKLVNTLGPNLQNLETVTVDYEVKESDLFYWAVQFPHFVYHSLLFSSCEVNDFCVYFCNIKHLTLRSVNLDDMDLGYMLIWLKALEDVEINNLPINGDCFTNIGSKLRCLNWKTNEKFPFSNNLSFKSKRGNLSQLSIESGMDFIKIDALNTSIPDLQHLSLNVAHVRNFDRINLRSLHSLQLTVKDVKSGKFHIKKSIKSVKKLSITIDSVAEVDLAIILYDFPGVEQLEINVKLNDTFMFTLIDAMQNMKNLKYLKYTENNYRSGLYEYEDPDGGMCNSLFAAIAGINSSPMFKLRFNYNRNYAGPIYVNELMNALQDMAAENTDRLFKVEMRGEFQHQTEEEANVIINRMDAADASSFIDIERYQ